MKTRHRRTRSRRPGMPSQGYVQELLPLYQKPVVLASDTPAVSDTPSVPLPVQAFANLATALYAAFRDLAELRERYTTLHGKRAERLLERVQAVVCEQITLLEHHLDQQELFAALRRLSVEIRGALVFARGVCGLCEAQRLLHEPTGTYWQFGNALLALWRSCQAIATHMTKNEVIDTPISALSTLSA